MPRGLGRACVSFHFGCLSRSFNQSINQFSMDPNLFCQKIEHACMHAMSWLYGHLISNSTSPSSKILHKIYTRKIGTSSALMPPPPNPFAPLSLSCCSFRAFNRRRRASISSRDEEGGYVSATEVVDWFLVIVG